MFPYRDENETQRTSIVTGIIIALNVLVWIFVQGAGSDLPLARSVCELGLIPGELTLSLPPGTSFPMGEGIACATDPGRQMSHVFTSMFLHGSWLHLLGNMWFLWIFGDNIEDHLGHFKYLLFYLLCGLGAAFAQVILNPHSIVPTVGASGAIAGVLGAYFLLYPRAKVLIWFPILFLFYLPAWVTLGYWFAMQFVSGAATSLASYSDTRGGVAFWAHVGGFVAGIILIKLIPERPRRYRYGTW